MLTNLECPNCGAALAYTGTEETMQCSYCQKVVVVSESLRQPDASATPGLGPAAETEIQELLRQGQKVEAVKRMRQMTGLGLKESKEAVEEIEKGRPVQVPLRSRAAPPNLQSPIEAEADLRSLLAQGQKIEAIKLFHKTYGMGLKEAKDAVEAMEARATLEQALAGIRATGPATGQANEGASAARRGLPPWLLLALLFLACLVALYLISLTN